MFVSILLSNRCNFTRLRFFKSLFLNGFLLEKTLHFEVITGEDDDGCNLVLLLLSNSSFSGMVLAIIERDDEELLVIVGSSLPPGNCNRVGGVSSVA